MTIQSTLLVIALAMLGAMPAAAQTPGAAGGSTGGTSAGSSGQTVTEKARQHELAVVRCQQNRGVDCSSQEGLKERELLERNREEAIREGSRTLRPAQSVVPNTVRPTSPPSSSSRSSH
jgi:hypothetical protein